MQEVKTCKDCGKTLPISEFNKQPSNSDGKNKSCKKCYNKKRADKVKRPQPVETFIF